MRQVPRLSVLLLLQFYCQAMPYDFLPVQATAHLADHSILHAMTTQEAVEYGGPQSYSPELGMSEGTGASRVPENADSEGGTGSDHIDTFRRAPRLYEPPYEPSLNVEEENEAHQGYDIWDQHYQYMQEVHDALRPPSPDRYAPARQAYVMRRPERHIEQDDGAQEAPRVPPQPDQPQHRLNRFRRAFKGRGSKVGPSIE